MKKQEFRGRREWAHLGLHVEHLVDLDHHALPRGALTPPAAVSWAGLVGSEAAVQLGPPKYLNETILNTILKQPY